MGACSGDTAINSGNANILAYEPFCVGSGDRISYVDPGDTTIRMRRHSHDARHVAEDVDYGRTNGRCGETFFD
jgi:hypothetical protein